jgi:CRISPR-associated endonuclease/helicase Cas3
LAGALALLGEAGVALDGLAERDLAVYLVAAHHGRVRLGFRPLPFERPTDGRDIALGVADGEVLPAVAIPGMALPPSVLDLSPMRIGDAPSGPSWTTRIAGLRDRPDLGPFRLGFLEAVVRLADWRVSAVQAVQDA